MSVVEDRLRTIVADLLVLNQDEVRRESLLVDDLDADSIAFLELWFLLEKDFGLDLPEVKADEETLAMPLLDGVERLEAIGGQTTFFEFVKREIDARMDAGTLGPSVPRVVSEAAQAIDRDRRAVLARDHTVGSLAEILACRIPNGLSAGAPVVDLRLRDFFRFLTFGALVDYVTFLLGLRDAEKPA